MTEQTTPFGGTAVAEPPTALLPTAFDEVGDEGNRRKLAIVGAALGVVVLLVAAFFLLKGGGGDTATGPVPAASHPAPGAATGTQAGNTAGTAAKPIALPKPFRGNIGRDPFVPLAKVPTQADAADKAPTVKVDASTPTTNTPPATGGATVPTTPSGSNGGSTAVAGDSTAPLWVELDSVSKGSATFRIMYSDQVAIVYQHVAVPKAGGQTVFGQLFALLSVHNGTASVKYGDGTPFTVKPGYDSRHFLG
jgi:hypothetical protein